MCCSVRIFARFSLKSILASHLPTEDGVARHSEPRVPRTCLSKQRCLRTSSRPRRYALAPPPSARSIPRAAAHPKRDIRGDARLGIVQTRNALPSDAARARLPPRPRADLSPALKHTGHPGCEGIRPLPGLVAGTSPAPALHGRLGNENPSCSERAHGSSDADAPLVAAPAKTFLRAFRQTRKRSRLTAAPLSPARRIP
jgi:hypothetical protein